MSGFLFLSLPGEDINSIARRDNTTLIRTEIQTEPNYKRSPVTPGVRESSPLVRGPGPRSSPPQELERRRLAERNRQLLTALHVLKTNFTFTDVCKDRVTVSRAHTFSEIAFRKNII